MGASPPDAGILPCPLFSMVLPNRAPHSGLTADKGRIQNVLTFKTPSVSRRCGAGAKLLMRTHGQKLDLLRTKLVLVPGVVSTTELCRVGV